MRRQQIGAILIGFMLALGLVLLVQQQGQQLAGQPSPPAVQPAPPPERPRPAVQSPVPKASLPQVNGERVFADVEALSFVRSGASDRAQARAYIQDQLRQAGWKPTLQRFEQGMNVVAERPGTNPRAGKILVAAHYDTVPGSPGSDDNASGVAVVLEVARLLGDQRTARSLQLALFDQEERGLLGSRAYAGDDKRIRGLRGVIVLDMVGYACRTAGCQTYPEGLPLQPPSDRGDFIALVVDQAHAKLARSFVKQPGLPPVLTVPVPFRGLLTPDLLRSDHAPFWYRGIGAMLLTDTANFRTPHYHQPSDRPSTLDRPFLTGVAQLVVNALVTLLNPST